MAGDSMALLKKAIKLAKEVHKGKYRRDGSAPYFVHPKRVAALVRLVDGSEKQIALAYLHDAVENYDGNQRIIKEKIGKMFGKEFLGDTLLLTRGQNEDYFEYLGKIKGNKEILLIKLCDIVDNLSDKPTEKQKKKYAKALMKLFGY